jgi:CHAT domain-containing protein
MLNAPQILKPRRLYRWLGILFVTSLMLCLYVSSLGQFALGQSSGSFSGQSSALHRGLEQFQKGNLLDAIQTWEAIVNPAVNPSTNARSANARTAADEDDRIMAQKYLARAYQQAGKIDSAIALFAQLNRDYQRQGKWQQAGQILTEQAQLYSSLGQHRQAIVVLCDAPEGTVEEPKNSVELEPHCSPNSALGIAQRLADRPGMAAALGSLGNSYRLRGDYAAAIAYLGKSLEIAQLLQNHPYTMAAWNGIGNTYASLAKRSYRQLQYALQSADTSDMQKFQRDARRYDQTAIAYFENALTLAQTQNDPATELRSRLNLVVSYHRSVVGAQGLRSERALDDLRRAQMLLERLPASREKTFAAIRLANLWELVKLPPMEADIDLATRCLSGNGGGKDRALLNQAIAIAQQIQDSQSMAFALGRLGHWYECQQDYPQALKLTQQAQLLNPFQDSQYLWEWQSGRILQAQGNPNMAISAYESAVQTLSSLKADIAIASRDFQFDFRDTIEPIYRELTALYLAQSPNFQPHSKKTSKKPEFPTSFKFKSLTPNAQLATHQTPNFSFINAALKTIDGLRLAEARNYLGEDCSLPVSAKPTPWSNAKTAVFSTIILKDQVAVILSLPGADQNLHAQVYWIPASSTEIIQTVNDLRLKLEKRSDLAQTYLPLSKKLYDWLIQPFAEILQEADIETLVFIQDGILRSIPMAALHDGQQFLVEHYAIASTLSLALIDSTPLNPATLKVLGFGLTQPAVVEGPIFFEPLSFVRQELDQIKKILPDSKQLVDINFTRDRLKQELSQQSFPIVHLATHGKFGIDSRDTFLVTGRQTEEFQTHQPNQIPRQPEGRTRGSSSSGSITPKNYNEKLTINQLYQLLRDIRQGKALELLTLTACETAVGSDRDALGIAGISLQAGARSAVASLWQVDDRSTAQLITHFYQNLRQGMSRAKAIQMAQKTWLQQNPNSHPGYWAALILVGNWS